jgi:predicted acyltransferase
MASDTRVSATSPSARIASLDLFRGFLMFVLIGADFLAGYPFVPAWFKHSTTFGSISIIDLGAPLFVFAVGISLGLVFLRCTTNGGMVAEQRRYVRRGVVLIAFGIIGSTLLHRGIHIDWEIFQTIGLAGIIALPFITLPSHGRLAAAALLILTFQAIGRSEYGDWLRESDVGGLGGILGGIAWSGVILAGSTISAPLREGGPRLPSRLITLGALGLVIAAALRALQPFDKRLVTASCLALTSGLSVLTLLLFVVVSSRPRRWLLPFTVLGANALTAFILQGLGLLALTALIPAFSPMGTVLVALAGLYALCYAGTGWLYRRQRFIRL